MNFTSFFESKGFKWVTWIVATLIVLLFVFKAGMVVGHFKANFSHGWSDNYHRNFAGTRGRLMREIGDRDDYLQAHGVSGQVLKIDGNTIVIKGRDNIEKIVVVSEKTTIQRFRETIAVKDLKADDAIVVIGEPNDAGQIEAKFIRVMPEPPKASDALPPPPPAPGAPLEQPSL